MARNLRQRGAGRYERREKPKMRRETGSIWRETGILPRESQTGIRKPCRNTSQMRDFT
ncbi:hypothetical protein [Bacillus marinisedimentorum]|uniref:hypothetical protein n=1 Tax=Bacillus marinisedimentorum TaxID=1821260 RepID=UPI001471CC8C|nr:hypothetical protein [Bacillus marinisedimentorum]